MRLIARGVLIFLGILLAVSHSAAQDVNFKSVKGVAGFENPEKLLRQLVLTKRGGSYNTFCILGFEDSAGIRLAWVYWKEGRALILWEPATPQTPLSLSQRYLDLRKDVVESEAELKGSTYLVTRAWVNETVSACSKIGDKYTIRISHSKQK